MTTAITGQCHCGSVKWSATLSHKVELNCHCTMCRSLSGADYSSWLVIPSNQFTLLSGKEFISEYQATDQFSKGFCSKCGSTVHCINNDKFPRHVYLAKGNITSKYTKRPDIQVYTQDKAAWVTLDDSISVYDI